MNEQYRTENKYMIDPQTAAVISKRLQMCCAYDRNANAQGFYTVTSLYFDDFSNSSLTDNIVGQIKRKKYRIRIYNGQDNYIRLEKKTKHNQVGRKNSVLISQDTYHAILNGNYDINYEDSISPLMKEFYLDVVARHLKPRAVVEYDRQSFVYPYGDVRITLDHNIRFYIGDIDLFSDSKLIVPAIDKTQIVMEVKFTGYLPSHIKALVQQSVTSRQSVSKYSLCRMRSY